jgi:hypothetical protein
MRWMKYEEEVRQGKRKKKNTNVSQEIPEHSSYEPRGSAIYLEKFGPS